VHSDAATVLVALAPVVVGDVVLDVEGGAVGEVARDVVKGLEKPTVDERLLDSHRFE